MDARTANSARLVRLLTLGAMLCAPLVVARPAPEPSEPSSPPPPQTPAPAATPAPTPVEEKTPEAKPSEAAVPPPSPPPPAQRSGEVETLAILKDGSRVTGRLTGIDDQNYTIVIAGIPTKFSKDSVLRLEELPPVEVRYKQMRAALEDTDLDHRVMLAEWLRDRKRLDLALAEVESILKVDGAHPGALQLKKMLELQIDLNKDSERRKASKEPRKDSPSESQAEPDSEQEAESEKSGQFPVLSEDQVNLIRVYEIDLSNPPRLLIPRELISSLLSRYGDSGLLPPPEQRDLLYQARPTQILDLVYRLKAHDLYPLVKVMEDPASMAAFRQKVHQGWLINSCASVRCHGGENAGRLMLKHSRPNDAATYYTNFLILDRFRLADGRPLINYDDPEKSPLIQLAMPRNLTTRPHPVVRNTAGVDQWKPAIRSVDDRRYKATVEWIKSLYKPRPDYGLTYEPPTPKSVVPAATNAPGPR
ncbi:MAG: hypothetical protein U0573_13695 [Phycisphaerales bacterium]|nr:hypothetical protein [Planctomycetota bacterium]